MPTAPQDRDGFQVAVLCALPQEAESVLSVFDACYEDQDIHYGKAPGDQNSYNTGVIGKCNVVLVHMPSMGTNSAALAAAGLHTSFRGIQLALVVGICGVVPVHPTTKNDIMLGDVVLSTAVIQYDFGRTYPGGFRRKREVGDSLGRANPAIRSLLNMLAARQNRQRFNQLLERLVTSRQFSENNPDAVYPGMVHDRLYKASYIHHHQLGMTCEKCLMDVGTCSRDCKELGCEDDGLDRDRLAFKEEQSKRGERHTPYVHLGRFGSANTVMKSGQDRDRLSATDEVTAFEMEGAGVWDQYPTIVIKAACDYADSHKNKYWQGYAAAMAAACLKVFLDQYVIFDPLPGQDKLSQPVWHVPFSPMRGFIGREDELQRLEEKLFDPHDRRVVALVGLGGIGKSRLALELVHRIKVTQPQHSVFWIQASDQLTLERDMLKIGQELKISGINDEKANIIALVKQHLSLRSTNKWLLVLDNADDEALWCQRADSQQPEASLIECLPSTIMHGSILITTRTKRVATFLAENEVISLSTMTEDEATRLFVSKLQDPSLAADQSSLLILVDKLAHLPLAIVQAAAYVNMTQTTVHTYLDLLAQPETEVVKLLSKDYGDASRYPSAVNPVATTWFISFKHIQRQHVLATNFLSTMACLHEKSIPSSLLPETDSKIDSIDAIAVLTAYSFVTKQSSKDGEVDGIELYDVHQLVQLAARSWLNDRETLPEWTKACIVRLVKLLESVDEYDRSSWTIYLPHM